MQAGELKELKEFATRLALESSAVIRQYFRSNLSVDSKSDDTPVTIADKKAEEIMRGLIEREYPDHGIIGEEFGNKNPLAEYTWVLDPIDGTKSFIHGGFDFGSIIALNKNAEPIVGVINQPVLRELYIGDNVSAEFNGQKIQCADIADLNQAMCLVSDYLIQRKYQNPKGFESLLAQVKLCRSWGNCYGYALVASGWCHIMLDPVMAPWDLMGLIPIVRGSGAIITDYQGNNPAKGTSIVAACPKLHAQVIRVLADKTAHA